MARGRMISKSLSTSERRAKLHHTAGHLAEFCQSLYPLLVAHSDDFGKLTGSAFHVKHAIDPTSPRTESDFESALAALAKVGLIHWYEIEARKFIAINDFERHQQGLHKRKTSGEIPEPSEGQPVVSGDFREIPGNSLPTELNRTELELKGTEQNRPSRKKRALTTTWTPEFLTFWAAYPRKVKKEMAFAAWVKQRPPLDACLSALSWQVLTPDWTREQGQYIPHPSSWLNAQRWQDEPFHPPQDTTPLKPMKGDRMIQGVANLIRKYEAEAAEAEVDTFDV